MSAPLRRSFVALGSNLGDRRAHLERALRSLGDTPGVRLARSSSWIETDPVGGPPGQGRFLNGVVELETTLSARALLERLQAIEADAGRERSVPDGPRTLDLDLLFLGEERVQEQDLVVPHPRLEARTFVLAPLCELAPDLRLPGCGQSVRERLAELAGHALSPR